MNEAMMINLNQGVNCGAPFRSLSRMVGGGLCGIIGLLCSLEASADGRSWCSDDYFCQDERRGPHAEHAPAGKVHPPRGKGHAPRGKADTPRPGLGRDFKALDADGDGFLSFEEFSQSDRLSRIDEAKRRKLFVYLDRNKDGKLDMSELHPQAPRWLASLRKEFDRLDQDQSGGLSFDEFSKSSGFQQMKGSNQAQIFKRLDRNKDGEVQKHELKAAGGMGNHRGRHEPDLKKYDLDQSGGLSFEEFSKMPWVGRIPEDRRKNLFRKLDTNGDQEITPQEVRKLHAARGRHGSPHETRPFRNKRSHDKGPDKGPHDQRPQGRRPHGNAPHGEGGPPRHRGSVPDDQASPSIEEL